MPRSCKGNPELTDSFDLLYRGLEITTGGQRIHVYQELVESMKSRGLDPESFSSYLEVFKYGMPPHGGFAIGLERLAPLLERQRRLDAVGRFGLRCVRVVADLVDVDRVRGHAVVGADGVGTDGRLNRGCTAVVA